MVSCVLMVDFVVRHYHSPITVIVFAKYLVCNPTFDHIISTLPTGSRELKKDIVRKHIYESIFPLNNYQRMSARVQFVCCVVDLDIKCIRKIEVILNSNAFK